MTDRPALYELLGHLDAPREDRVRMVADYRREVLREAAEKIRAAPFEPHLLQAHQRHRAAAIIDPEVEE